MSDQVIEELSEVVSDYVHEIERLQALVDSGLRVMANYRRQWEEQDKQIKSLKSRLRLSQKKTRELRRETERLEAELERTRQNLTAAAYVAMGPGGR